MFWILELFCFANQFIGLKGSVVDDASSVEKQRRYMCIDFFSSFD